MPLVSTRGAASAQGFGQFAQSAPPVYIEEVFQTWLYTGNNSTQIITNGIDLAGKGGLVWSKCRSSDLGGNGIHTLIDTVRGAGNRISSDLDGGQVFNNNTITAFNSNGFSIGNSPINNTNAATFVSWAFREQPKFFDIVTYTGNGSLSSRLINHNLGSVPGCIMIKRINATSDWVVSHRSTTFPMFLQSMAAAASTNRNNGYPELSRATATQFDISDGASGVSNVNANGGTYVAYLFAHDAGGFGLTGTDNVISCGAYTGNGSTTGPIVNLGFEPQWILNKRVNDTSNWQILDTMRGLSYSIGGELSANQISAEGATASGQQKYGLLANGFQVITTDNGYNNSGSTYIYIAIRRGPMRVPTTGTSVYYAQATQDVNTSFTTGFPVDMVIDRYGFWNDAQTPQTGSFYVYDRLRGSPRNLTINSTAAETSSQPSFFVATTGFESNTRLGVGPGDGSLGNNYAFFWNFGRAPGFFDEVCYTGTGSNPNTLNHNLGVIPEFVIYRRRNSTGDWETGVKRNDGVYSQQSLNSTGAAYGTLANAATAGLTATTINPPAFGTGVNVSGGTYVAYLFASCPGVSSVGSFTGTGATQVINCGFTAGARFVLIRATSTTGNWLLWDSARGIVSGNDPYIALNSSAAQVTNTDWVDTAATGFELSNAGGNLANSNGVSYIFLAIA